MCGRLVHTLTPEDYATYLDLAVPFLEPNLDVRPTDTVPIVRQREGSPECVLARWGFPLKGSKVLFNARSETVAELPSFRNAYRHRRALLFASGWYEWKDKKRYLIQRKDHKPVVMAVLWQEDRFTILTTIPTTDLAQYHDRMPVMILKKNWGKWLEGMDVEQLEEFPSGVMLGIASTI